MPGQKMSSSRLIWLFVTLFAVIFLANSVYNFYQDYQSIGIAQKQLDQKTETIKQTTKQHQTYEKVTTADIRDTSELQKVGHQFLTEMFNTLKQKDISDATSTVATKDVVSAFLGATFGGDVDEGRPKIKLTDNDLVYSKNADGTGLGFGTVTYQQDSQTVKLTLLMRIQDGKITELQTGQVKDTTGGTTND